MNNWNTDAKIVFVAGFTIISCGFAFGIEHSHNPFWIDQFYIAICIVFWAVFKSK